MLDNESLIISGVEDDSEFSAFYHTYKLFSNNESSMEQHSNFSLLHLSRKNEILLKFVVEGVALLIVAIMGVFGNIFSILVLSKQKMRSPISCFLIGLAGADTIFTLIAAIVLGLPNCLSYFDTGHSENSSMSTSSLVMLTPLFFGLALTSQTASVYFTLAVATERFIAVYFPFKARTSLTIKRAVCISVGVIVFAILYNVPRWFEYDVQPIYDHNTHELIGYQPMPSSLKNNQIYDDFYCYLSYLVFMNVFPTTYLSILNILIYKKIRAAHRERQSFSSQQEKSHDLSIMLLVIVGVFLFCNILPMVEGILMKTLHHKQTYVEFECIRNFLIVFNSSINFLIYTFLGEKFREIFVQMWPSWLQNCCFWCSPKQDQILRYWHPSLSNGSSGGKFRLSLCTHSTKTLKDVHLNSVFVTPVK